ncbi:MAG: 2,3-bisphosphoglycerate-independent phosphoglycerate mutase [Phycisphaerales bacterium]|nr:2,3-bisphosphoglycerate-independent phosphoglycerate mutase [Phycisphaerales bacterium]
MPPTLTNTPCVLVIRDGWGHNPNPSHDAFNAVKIARTPAADRLMREYPWTLIRTSGEDVGLPEGTMGNSEVGHQNIGAGRVVPQESLVMTRACRAGLEGNAAIAGAVERCKGSGRSLHLMGINSDAGVHGLLEHLFAILAACRTLGMDGSRVFVHLFTDGRDTGPFTGLGFAQKVEAECARLGVGRVASVIGRYYAMDRDNRWERVKLAYDCLTGRGGGGAAAGGAAEAIRAYYDRPSGETMKGDEFVPPTAVGTVEAVRASRIRDGDSVLFYNYRGDRPRELSAALVFPDSEWAKVKPSPDSGARGFDRGPRLSLHYVTMTEYWEALTPHVSAVAFPKPAKMEGIGGAWISGLGLRQFRCAETEKFPHVTFFFNDYRDEPFPGESREIVQSPKVATYDLAPEMSAAGVRDAVLGRLGAADCEPFIVVNFANADMVGHTGSLPAAVRACEMVDSCVGSIVEAALRRGGSLIVTADHGNAEQMFDPATGAPHTAHTTYDVPLIVVGERFRGRRLAGRRDADHAGDARLGDIVPTMLEMMGLEKPAAMSGRSLLAGV